MLTGRRDGGGAAVAAAAVDTTRKKKRDGFIYRVRALDGQRVSFVSVSGYYPELRL